MYVESGNILHAHPLMWSHYANNHKGFCLKYSFSKDFFCSDRDNLFTLTYHKMKYEAWQELQDSILASKALITKSEILKYENEYRILLFDPIQVQNNRSN